MAESENNSGKRSRRPSGNKSTEGDDGIALDLVKLLNDASVKRTSDATSQQPSSANYETRRQRDDNPFSFRQFLHSGHGYQSQGARPKVYCEGRQVTVPSPAMDVSDTHTSPRLAAEYPSALPDFVQDHLVIEQCYINKNNSNTYSPTDAVPINHQARGEQNGNMGRPQAEFPLDLPLAGGDSAVQSLALPEVVGNSKSLPDFLADGAVRNQQQPQVIENGSRLSPEREVDRLRMELELTRRQLMEQTRRGDALAHDLQVARNKEHEYTQSLAKALEQVEENIERSKIRANASENSIVKLRQDAKALNREIMRLRKENAALQARDEAAGYSSAPSVKNHFDSNAQKRMAQDLRIAASTAEQSLRHLLGGVDNLRLLAARLENESNLASEDDDSDGNIDTGPVV